MSNPTPIRKKHILNHQSSDALAVYPVRSETAASGVSNILRFRMSGDRKFSFRDLSLSSIALRMKANRERKEMQRMIEQFSEYFTSTRTSTRTESELIKKQKLDSAARQRMDFSKQRDPFLLEAIDKRIAERQNNKLTRQEALTALLPKEKDPLAIAILHWCHRDLPIVCKQIKDFVKDIEEVYRSQTGEFNRWQIKFTSTESALPGHIDMNKLAKVYELLDKADPKELLPYGYENQDFDLPELKPMDEKTELIYRWMCSNMDVRYKAMYSIVWHKAFKEAGIDREIFRLIEEIENNEREKMEEMAARAGFDPYHHIDTDALQEKLNVRMNFSEALLTFWKEIKARL